MSSALRRPSLMLLLWLLLALLPLRGWAHLSMHLSAPASAPVAAPCHVEADADVNADADADASGLAKPCALCDICHGAMLLQPEAASPGEDRRAQPLPESAPAAPAAAEADALFRPPRS